MDDSTFFSTTLGEWIRDCFCSTSSASAEGSPLTFPLTLVNRAEANLRERNGSKFGKEISYERLCDGFTLNQLFRFISSNNNYNFCNSSSDEQIFQEFANLLPYKSCFNTLNSSQHRNMISTKKLSRLSAYCNGTTTNLLDRLRWFHILKRNLQNFYWMNSLYVKSFPDIISIVKLSKAEASGHEMLKLIGLLLGAAVQSEQREIFIERIKSMRPELQHALIAEIQRVTTDGEEVMNLETLQQLAQQHSENNNGNHNGTSDENPLQENDKGINNGEQKEQILTSLIDCMMKERDDYATALLDIVTSNMPQQTEAVNATQRDGECSPSSSSYTNSNTYSDSVVASRGNYDRRRTPSPTNDRIPTSALLTKTTEVMSTSSLTSCATTSAGTSANELNTIAINDVARNVSAVEYAALKAEVRKLRNENEEHEELMMDLQEEMEKRDAHISKLQAERLDLVKDARAAKDYRDEIDCMQHKLIKLERLEAENEKLKSKLAEVHFYKTRVNSLKEDNDLVQQTCRVLEEQLEQCQRKLSNYLEIEGRMIESQANVKSLQLDLAKTREQVEDLLVENGRLERESKEHAQKCLELQRRMDLMVSSNSPRENPPNNNNMLWNTNGTTTTPIQNGSSNGGNSLTDSSLLAQLDACNQTQILELQLENRKLKSQIENMANSTNPAELFELRAELTAAKKSIEACESEKTEITGKYEAEKSARAESDAQQKALQQRLVEAELVADEMKRTTTSLNQEQIDALRTKIVNLEQEAKSKSSEVSSVRDEKSQIETQLDKMRAQQKSARAEIDKLSEALSDAERTRDSLERSRRTLESERTALKLRLDVAEDRINELDKRACEMEGTRQTLAKVEEQLRTKTNELAALESANRKLKEEIECNARKEFELREDLTSERTRIAGLIHRLRSVYASINLNNGDVSGAEANKQINTNGILDNDAQLVATIDEVLMRAFNTTRRESDTLRIQQQMQIRELDDLKRDIEALRKAESELPASGDKYSQILFENKSAKEQVSILQERLRRLQIDEATRCAELQAARREIDELQQKMFAQNRQNAELSNMKVTLRNNQAQEELLRRECVELRTRLDAISIERNNAQHASQALTTINRALANDHDRLQQLHQALSSDYERVKHDANALKQRSKTEKNALESGLRAQFERERVALEEKLADEMAERQRFFQKLVDCEAELAAVSKELMEMRRERSPPSTVYFGTPPPQQHQTESVQQQANELRRLRLLECAQKSTINNLNMTIQQLNNLLTEKDLEIANLRRQIDMLRQYNGEESRSLIRQIELLLIQNQQLHTRSDVFYAEQKELQEKLAQLRRHKEKLEEKIMDQYKAMDSRKIEAKPTFVRRAAKALISKSPGRKASNTSTRTSVRREGASSSNTEESSVYSADETLFASNGGDSNSPIPAPPHMPPPPTSNNNHGLSQQQQQKLQCCQQQQQQQQKQQIAAVTDDQQQGSGGKASALIVTNKCTAYTNNNCTAAPMNGHHGVPMNLSLTNTAPQHDGLVHSHQLDTNLSTTIHSTQVYLTTHTALQANSNKIRSIRRDSPDLIEKPNNFYRRLLFDASANENGRRAMSLTPNPPKNRRRTIASIEKYCGGEIPPKAADDFGMSANLRREKFDSIDSKYSTLDSCKMNSHNLSNRSSPWSGGSEFTTKSRLNKGNEKGGAGVGGRIDAKSGASVFLQRFFSRSSPLRRSTATCSSYSSASPTNTTSSSSGCSVMSSASSTCSSATAQSVRTFSPVFDDRCAAAPRNETNGTLVVIPMKTSQIPRKMRTSTSLCFKISKASKIASSNFRQQHSEKSKQSLELKEIGVQNQLIKKNKARIALDLSNDSHWKLEAEKKVGEILYASGQSDERAGDLQDVEIILAGRSGLAAGCYESFRRHHRQRLADFAAANKLNYAAQTNRLSAYDNVTS